MSLERLRLVATHLLSDLNTFLLRPPIEHPATVELAANQAEYQAKRKAYEISSKLSLSSSLGLNPEREQLLRLFLA